MSHKQSQIVSQTFLLGAIVGGLAVALFTPRNGREMRQAIKRRAEVKRDMLQEKADQLATDAQKGLQKAQGALNNRKSQNSDNDQPPIL